MYHVAAQQPFLLSHRELAEFPFQDYMHTYCARILAERAIGEAVSEIIAIVVDFLCRVHFKQFGIKIGLFQFQRLIGDDLVGLAVAIIVKTERQIYNNLIYGRAVEPGAHAAVESRLKFILDAFYHRTRAFIAIGKAPDDAYRVFRNPVALAA